MAFRYSLQKIVDLKGNQKTQAEWMLSEAIGKLREEELALGRLLRERSEQQELLRQAAEAAAPVADLRALQHYIDHLQHLIERKSEEVSSAQGRVSQCQQVLMDRTIDEKVWLKSRDRAYQSFLSLMLKKEQAELDEIASVRRELVR